MDYAGACADYILPVASHIPGQPYAWGEIVVITVVGGSLSLADLYESGWRVRIEVSEEIVLLLDDRLQLVTQAEGDGECWQGAIVVLEEDRVILIVHMTHGGSFENCGPLPNVS